MKRVFTVPERTHGSGPVFFTWQLSNGNYLITTGYDQCVNIYDRHGEKRDQISLSGMCVGMSWDKDGDILGIINDRSPILIIWDSNTQRITQVDTGLRDALSLLLWSVTGPVLAIGTAKGNLLIYNHRTSRKVPVLGKHSRRISFGAWSKQNYLALVGEDKMLTVSNQDGDTVCQASLKSEPSLVQFSSMRQDEKGSGENTVSLILGKKTLYLLNIYDPENPIVLAFQDRYGSIVDYKWFGDSNILLGFSNGYFITISTNMKDIGQELSQIRCHRDHLSHMSVCLQQNKVASCGDNTIKIYDLNDLEEVQSIIAVDEEQELEWLEWTEDGQLLSVAGGTGSVYVYLTKLPILGDSFGPKYAMLTSLLEVTVANVLEQDSPTVFRVDIEPGFVAMGLYHLAVGMNNRAWFYGLGNKGGMPLRDREYLGTVQCLKMNSDYAAALFEGKIQLHMIEGDYTDSEERESCLFPDGDYNNIKIKCHDMTTDFLIYGTSTGSLQFFLLEDWQLVNEYRHPTGIQKLSADPSGTRIFIVDDKQDGYIYNPVNDHLTEIPNLPKVVKGCLWDVWPLDKDVFVLYDDTQIYTFVYARETIEGPKVELAGTTKLTTGHRPLVLYNGELTSQTPGGKTSALMLSTHQLGDKIKDFTQVELREALDKTLKIHRFREAWTICQLLNKKEDWETLAKSTMYNLDIDLAIRVYQHIGDVGMVWSLQNVKSIEDRQLLSGHLATFNGNFNLAQDLYLSSSNPVAALEMRRDLLHWDQALQLAKKLDPDQVPYISREYAQQLEFVGDYVNALNHYEKGLTNNENEDQNKACLSGIARTSLRCGNIRKGVQIAMESNNKILKKECAEILDNMKQYAEAAILYENGSYFDKAAALLIKLKNWKKVGDLLPNITSAKIHSQYAKARENEGYYSDAAKAYLVARDYESVIRIQLDHLNNPEESVKLVKETKSVEGAKMVARFFQRLNDMTSAIQFLVMSKCNNEAFQLSQSTGKMDIYAEAVGGDASKEDLHSIAIFYENEKNYLKAGKFFFRCGQHKKAVKYLLRSMGSDDGQAMQLAIEAVGQAQDDQLTRQVIEYLMGETDGVPKDFKYLFRLYMALKHYRDAAKTAIIIAREEQNAGNYRNAHDVLFSMYKELQKQRIKIPSEMYANLMILHSYILVKIHVRRGDDLKGARMLIRIANNISKFPSHVVPILTSTVIECHKAGLKKSAFSYAAMLMRPEYRNQIDLKYKKKIEGIVRKPQKAEEDEETSPCPYCDNTLTQSELSCIECRNNIPFCIITGWHIIKEGITSCPNCNFPAIATHFQALLETESSCPMCSEKVQAEDLKIIHDLKPYLYPEGEE